MKNISYDRNLANSGNPTSSMIVASEFKLPKNVNYPHTFTVIASPYDGGKKAEAKFVLQMIGRGETPKHRKLN